MKKGCYAVRRLRGYGFDTRRFRPNRLTANRLTAFLLTAFLAVLTSTAVADEVYRFLDTTTSPVISMGINGVFKRVLNPRRSAEAFELPRLPGTPTLSFSIGQQPTAAGGTVRFEIELEREGQWEPIYGKNLSDAGWIDERLTLPADTPRVRFRRKLLAGTKERAEKSAFGDPIIIPADVAKRPSVILISLDTLRADRLGLAGRKEARTPVLDAFGKSGVWYTQAYSPSAWTLPSHASLLYGFSLPTVPVRGDPVATAPEAPSIAEILRSAGYLTAGFTGGGYLAPNFAFDRGFDTYYAFPQKVTDIENCTPQRFDGPEVFRRGAEWLRDRGQAPFFLFLHTYDVHDRCPFQPKTKPVDTPWNTLDAAGHARLLAYYDDLIAETDTRVGALLHELDTLKLRDNTLVIITSDHGELLNEHNQRGHGCPNLTLWEDLIRVPLLIRYPARIKPSAPDRRPVSLVDVAPTILTLLDLPPASSMTGVPLPGFGTANDGTRPVLIACENQVAVRQGALKLIASRKPSDQPQLFDVERDPGEKENLFTTERAEPLLRIAEQHWEDARLAPPQTPREVDAETKERLRALGYNP